ncbi:TSUP family transporter [Rothia sp. ZJ932]|uniref:TSUP family transporter n=1 Tax=Rothia sp. ZJ932 TaxID=2810516 RepID=UPI0019680992|nr:TSUP family transporter [Rothia sp. ZJ932]QRZ61107.1 TSUP family transporter [Rothia sp. ZJ932]
MEALAPTAIILLLFAALLAGWVDAVVGGGGLIQLPAVLLVPGLTPVQALAVNKLSSICGTITSAVTYYRRTTTDIKTALPMATLALCASCGGAAAATIIPAQVFTPIIIVALFAVLVFTIVKPAEGELTALRITGRKHLGIALGLAAGIGFYDGILGPGTGSFLMMGMVVFLGYSMLQSVAQTKVINAATNLGALIFFTLGGHQIWALGLLMGFANMVGGYWGARTAIARGAGFIRVLMVVVVSALILKLGWDALAS